MKKTLKILLSAVLALLTVLLASVSAVAVDEPTATAEAASEAETTEIPLLIISASFDANGNGVNDYDDANPTKLHSNPQDDYYGEEWAEVSADAYYDSFFGDGYSVSNFYYEMTMHKIKFVPVIQGEIFDRIPIRKVIIQNHLLPEIFRCHLLCKFQNLFFFETDALLEKSNVAMM